MNLKGVISIRFKYMFQELLTLESGNWPKRIKEIRETLEEFEDLPLKILSQAQHQRKSEK